MKYSKFVLTLAASAAISAAPLAIRDDAAPSNDRVSFLATSTTIATDTAADSTTDVTTGAAIDAATDDFSFITEVPTDDDPLTLDPDFWKSNVIAYPIYTGTIVSTFDPWAPTFTDSHTTFYIIRSPYGFVGDRVFRSGTKRDSGIENKEEEKDVEAIPTDVASATTASDSSGVETTTVDGDDPLILDPNFWESHYVGYQLFTGTVATTFNPWGQTFTDFNKPYYISFPEYRKGTIKIRGNDKRDNDNAKNYEEEQGFVEAFTTGEATPTTTIVTSSITEVPAEAEQSDDLLTLDPNFWSSHYAGFPIDKDGHTLSVATTFNPDDGTWPDWDQEFYITRAPDGWLGDTYFAQENKRDAGVEHVEAVTTVLI